MDVLVKLDELDRHAVGRPDNREDQPIIRAAHLIEATLVAAILACLQPERGTGGQDETWPRGLVNVDTSPGGSIQPELSGEGGAAVVTDDHEAGVGIGTGATIVTTAAKFVADLDMQAVAEIAIRGRERCQK